MRDLAAIILAAGGSTRLGRPKQLLKYQGKTLLRRTVDLAIGAECHPVVVVLGHQADQMQQELSGLQIVPAINTLWQRGIGSSIRQGFSQLIQSHPHAAATILLLCDQPLLAIDDLRRLIDAAQRSGKPVCACGYENTIGPPVLVRQELFAALQGLPDAQGAKAIWTQHPELLEVVSCPNAATDIDTDEDLRRLF